ncbi:MAG: hypothetical protein RI936_1032 [Pseudomonadota bacterium]
MPALPCPSADSTAPPPVDDRVIVVPADPTWAVRYRIEAQLLRVVLSELDPGVEHIGSTAVPGLAAKPVIDLLIGVPGLERFAPYAHRLLAYGYEYVADQERNVPDRRFFKRVVAGVRTHHLHVVQRDGPLWQRYLGFRDALRADPALAQRYAQLKLALAERHPDDREAYTAGKTSFVECVLAARCGGGAPRMLTALAA